MTAVAVTMTDIERLAAVLDHARQHDLVDTISSVAPGGPNPYGGPDIPGCVFVDSVPAFVRWAKSIDAGAVEFDEDVRYVSAAAHLDGCRFSVSMGGRHLGTDTARSIEVACGVRCGDCGQVLDGSEPTAKVGTGHELVHIACVDGEAGA